MLAERGVCSDRRGRTLATRGPDALGDQLPQGDATDLRREIPKRELHPRISPPEKRGLAESIGGRHGIGRIEAKQERTDEIAEPFALSLECNTGREADCTGARRHAQQRRAPMRLRVTGDPDGEKRRGERNVDVEEFDSFDPISAHRSYPLRHAALEARARQSYLPLTHAQRSTALIRGDRKPARRTHARKVPRRQPGVTGSHAEGMRVPARNLRPGPTPARRLRWRARQERDRLRRRSARLGQPTCAGSASREE